MKSHTSSQPVPYQPTDEEIREKARELYVGSGSIPGRDLENWLEAEAFLQAQPPGDATPHRPHGRVRSHSLRANRDRPA